jgi:hypothetical protein
MVILLSDKTDLRAQGQYILHNDERANSLRHINLIHVCNQMTEVQKTDRKPGVVVHTCNSTTEMAEARQ